VPFDGTVQSIEVSAGVAAYSDPAVRAVRLRCATGSFEYSFVPDFAAGTGCVVPAGDSTCVFLVSRDMCLAPHAVESNFMVYVLGEAKDVLSISIEPYNPPAGW